MPTTPAQLADAQHGKPAAQRMACQGAQRDVQCQYQGHAKTPSHAGSQKSMVDTGISRALDTNKGIHTARAWRRSICTRV